ncbi:MAG TPA: hemerythrin domain-containing protein [Streptosporangiaceae bacterium]|jgi:hemerythrin-like domain-containing protein
MTVAPPPSDPAPSPSSPASSRAPLHPRVVALGRELAAVHDELRRSLRQLRAELAEPGSTAQPARSLQAHCAGFCSALARHHGSEDAAAFPLLARQVPELAPVLAELQADHQVIASILRRIEELASGAGPGNAARVRGELDGLAAILESHFRWEERRVTAALDALDPAVHPAAELFGPLPARGPAAAR